MAGKKWCEYCRINLPYDKKAIQEHEATRRHIQNKEKHIKFERIKIQRQQKAAKDALKSQASLITTANIPKAKKGSQLQRQVQQYRNDVIASGKMAIHQLIAQKTKGLYGAPIQYPEKEDLVLAENYQDQDELNKSDEEQGQGKFEMWKIDICEQTGKACFINRITQAKVYEPPKGYVMSEQQKEQWEQTKKICQQIPQQNLQQMGEAGQWQEVQEEDYFATNKAESQEQQIAQRTNLINNTYTTNENSIKIEVKKQAKLQNNQICSTVKIQQAKPHSWMDELQQKLQNNQLNQQQVIGTMLTNTLDECRTVKQKNEALKKLVKNDFEIRTTLDKNNLYELKQEDGAENKKSIGIKPRKKVKTCQLIQQKDIV